MPSIARIADRGPRRYRFEVALADDQSVEDLTAALLRRPLDSGVAIRTLSEHDSLESDLPAHHRQRRAGQRRW